MPLRNNSAPFSNFSRKFSSPHAIAALPSSNINSSNRRMARTIVPSNKSVRNNTSENVFPPAHSCTISTKNVRNESTYFSTSISSFCSSCVLAMSFAASKTPLIGTSRFFGMVGFWFDFSVGTNMEHNATSSLGVAFAKAPLNINSVAKSSSAVSISHAHRPLGKTTPSASTWLSLRKTFEREDNSSRNLDSSLVFMREDNTLDRSSRVAFFSNIAFSSKSSFGAFLSFIFALSVFCFS
mmetsp:Transcript_2374/g.8486  ORF Transcript_2374/g.8486 Transcript_2374/m.8486 type:complete len:239 (+) Transcript_2374:1304-2020(+)